MRISIHACLKLILSLAGFALLCTGLPAQISTGSIRGTVTDQQGATVPGASVKVTNVDTNFAVTAVSNAQGIYSVSDLPVGHYQVDASHEGFNAGRTTFELTVGKQQVVDFALRVGTVAQTVTVSADVPQVETTDNSIGWLIDQQQIENLPLQGRNLAQLILLAPGVSPVPQENSEEASTVVPFGFGSPQRFSVAGARPQGQLFLLDGTDTSGVWGNGSGLNLAGTSLGVDGVEEFQTLTDTYTAKYGGNGAAVNAVERSGTNDLHGSAFEYNRNSALSARNYFETSSSPLALNRNQFGGTLGGPIRKDKTFFFVNYEQLNLMQATNLITDVPDNNFRMGILPCTQVAGATGCTPSTFYNVPVGIAPGVAPVLASYPLPNGPELLDANGNPTGVAESIFSPSQPTHEHYGLAKITQVLSQNDTLDISYLIDDGQLTIFANPTITDQDTQRNQYVTIEERKVLSSNLLNVAHLGYARSKIVVATETNPAFNIIAGSTFNGTFIVPGLSTIGGEDNSTEALNRYTGRDQISYTHGRHSLEAGVEVVYHQINANIPIGNGGDVAYYDLQGFGIPLTSYEAFLTNTPLLFAGVPLNQADSTRDIRHWNYSPYVQDKFQWTPKLTINVGLRYDFETNPTETHDKLYNIVDPYTSTGFTQVPHAFQNNPTRYNFEPRIGFAWDPTPNHKTSIRGGFGVFDDLPLEMQVAISYLFNPPIYNIEDIYFPTIPNPFQGGSAAPGLPSSAQLTAYKTDHDPYIMQYNVTLQQDLGNHTVATLAYIGSKAVHLFIGDETNACLPTSINAAGYYVRNYGGATTTCPTPNPALGSVVDRFPSGESNYNSMQITLERGIGRYAEFRTGYTWSKCLDVGSYYTGNDSIGPDGQTFGVIAGSLENAYRNGDYGPCDFDLRNNWFGNALVNLPFQGAWYKDGWQISGISFARSGSPYSVYDGFDQAEVGAGGAVNNAERPDLAPGTRNGNPTSITHSGGNVVGYNASAFVLQPEGVFGNLGRNTLYSPAYTDIDLGLLKATKISERTNLQIRADAFNVLNHTNFSYPNAQLFIPGTGLITSTNGSNRVMQLSAKYVF